ncbi:MAG: hypothetical protein AAF242_06840 [Bacteroidota bacterium]
MEQSKLTFTDRVSNPIFQAALVFGGVLLTIAMGAILKTSGMGMSERWPWMCATSFMLFFAMFNSVFALTSKTLSKYWGKSIYSFLGLAFISGLMAYMSSGLSINEAGSYRWIYIVVTIGYMIFLGMATMMRTIVDFAQKEEWSSPKRRDRNRPSERDRHIK